MTSLNFPHITIAFLSGFAISQLLGMIKDKPLVVTVNNKDESNMNRNYDNIPTPCTRKEYNYIEKPENHKQPYAEPDNNYMRRESHDQPNKPADILAFHNSVSRPNDGCR